MIPQAWPLQRQFAQVEHDPILFRECRETPNAVHDVPKTQRAPVRLAEVLLSTGERGHRPGQETAPPTRATSRQSYSRKLPAEGASRNSQAIAPHVRH